MKLLAHDSERYGYLSLNGAALSSDYTARRCGTTLEQYATLIAELDLLKVLDRTPEGVIFFAELLEQAKRRSADKEKKRRKRNLSPVCPPPVPRVSEEEREVEVERTSETVGESEGLKYHKDARSVLFYLREATGRVFQENDTNLALISARLRDCKGTFEDTKAMIDRQCKRWKGTDQEEYLRPETLFGKTKFDGYYSARNLPVNTGTNKENPRNTGIAPDPTYSLRLAAKVAAMQGNPQPLPNGVATEVAGARRDGASSAANG